MSQIPEDLQTWNEILLRERNSDIKHRIDPEEVIPLIERISRAEDALVTLAKQHAASGVRIAQLQAERDALREALKLYEATAADEMKYSPEFQRCSEVARAALAQASSLPFHAGCGAYHAEGQCPTGSLPQPVEEQKP